MQKTGPKGELTFELSEKLEFINLDGQQDDTTYEITFRGPTYREMDQAAKLEQHLYHCFRNAQEAPRPEQVEQEVEQPQELVEDSGQSQDDDDMTPERAWTLLSMYSHDITVILRDFQKLAEKVGRLNEKTPLTTKMIHSMTPDNIKRMCAEYMAFFICPSVVSTMKALK